MVTPNSRCDAGDERKRRTRTLVQVNRKMTGRKRETKNERTTEEAGKTSGEWSDVVISPPLPYPAFSIFRDTPLLHYACRDEKMENTAVLSAGMLYEI